MIIKVIKDCHFSISFAFYHNGELKQHGCYCGKEKRWSWESYYIGLMDWMYGRGF